MDAQTDNGQINETVSITMPEEVIKPAEVPNPQLLHNDIQPQKQELSTENPQTKTEEKPKVGRPCKYCSNKEGYQKIVDEYIKKHEESEKPTIPWIEELALKMRIDDETLTIWAKKEKSGEVTLSGEDELEHPELSASFRMLKTLQKFRLKQRSIGRFNPHGALYLLNADHKVIQTNKEVLANDGDNTLKITIVEEEK